MESPPWSHESPEILPNIEKQEPPEIDWDKINTAIREMFADDDEEVQRKSLENASWLKEYMERQSEIITAIKEEIAKKETERLKQQEEERKKLEQQEEERKRARRILEEWYEKTERENNPVLIYFKRMTKIIESEQNIAEKRQD